MSIDWDSEIKGPQDALLDLPQERITGDILRGRGPRRGNLERLIKYWRPIMRKPGGFRRCLVILANHPELYPLERICAWLHHETTGLWPNEGNHHEGGKLGPIVGRARRYLKKPKKRRKRRGRKDLGESDFHQYEYGFKDVVSQSRVFDGVMVQPIKGRPNVVDYKAAMFMDRLEEVSERKEEIEFKKVGIVGSGSASGQALQAIGSILLPGDISAFRSPVRSQIYETLTPGGGRGVRRGLRRVVRGAGRGARNKFRCPPGFQKGGTFTNKFYSTCGAQILGIPSFGPGAFTAGIERALARLARDASLVRSIGDLKNNSNPYAVIRAAQIPFAPKKTNPTRRQTSVDLVLARIANGENVPTRFVRRDGVILEPLVSFEELGKLDEFDDMVDGSLMTVYKEGILGEGSLGTFGTGLRDNYITIEDEGVVKVSRVGGELEQGVRDKTVRAFNASIAKANRSRNPDRTEPLMDFIEASNGKFSVEFGEIKNNKFVPDNTSKNELIKVRSGNMTKLVPKWVYDTFLSRSAPQRLSNDPIFEIVEGDAKSIPFFNSGKINKENIHLARDYFNLVNEKAARFTSTVADTELDVKAPRFGRRLARGVGRGAGRGIRGTASAVFDSDLGRFRCPPGTRYGGTFTDRLGTNCGYSLPNKLVDRLGRATSAAKSIVRGIRVSDDDRRGYKKITDRLKRFNEDMERVLNLTESRAGTRLGATIGQRRAITGLSDRDKRLFSGQSTREMLESVQKTANKAFNTGDRKSINAIWDELSKLANLEAGRLTANSDDSNRAVGTAEKIQNILSRLSDQLIDRAELGDEGRSALRRANRNIAGLRDGDVEEVVPVKPTLSLRKERFDTLRDALSRGRRMKKIGEPIPDIIPSAFYNDDGTLNKEKVDSAREAVKKQTTLMKQYAQQLIGSNVRDLDQIDEGLAKYIADVDSDNMKFGDVTAPRVLNTFRELRALEKMDDQQLVENFDDTVRRLGRVDKMNILRAMDIDPPRRDWDRLERMDDGSNEIYEMDDLGVPEARRSRSGFVQGVKQRVADKKDALRSRLDKRLFREYADGDTVDTAVQDTMLENPDLPESLTEVATVPWEAYGRILGFKQQRDLNGYVAMSELPDAALLDIYERTGIVIAPRGQYDFTEDIEIFGEEVLSIPKGQTDITDPVRATQNFTKWINNAMGNTDYGDTPNENSIGAIPVAVGQVRDTNTGEVIDVVAEVVFDPLEDEVFVPEESLNEGAGVHTRFVMQLRTNDGSIIYQARDVGDDYKLNGLSIGFDFEEKSVNLDHIGVNHTVPETFEGFEVVGDPIQFKGGRFANTVINERLMPFLRGAGFEKIKIDGTSGTGAGTWIRYGFTEQAGTLAAPPTLYKRLVSGKNQVITGNLVGDVDSALGKLRNGEDLTPNEVIAMAIVGTPETLEDMRVIDRVLQDTPNDAPGAYEIYSILTGVNDDGSLKRSTPLYRAMIADEYDLSESEVNDLNAAIDRAFESFGVTKPEAATSMQTQGNAGKAAVEYGTTKGVDVLADTGLELDISKRSIIPQTESLWGTPAEGGVAVSTAFRALPTEMEQEQIDEALRRIAGVRDRDAYGKVISRLGKRHSALMTGEERARYASEIERALDRLSREGILNEDDSELNELVGLAAALRDTTNFPEEIGPNRGVRLADISVDLGDVGTIDNLIDDVKFLIAETDTPADLEKLLKILEDAKAEDGGRIASRAVQKASNMSDSKVVTGLSALKENFKNKRFRRNPFTLDEADRNKEIAETLTLWDELLRQTDRDADDPRRGIDAIMGQVVDIAEAENMTPEEVIQRSLAHTLMETNYWPESELTSGKSTFELWGIEGTDDPDFVPASSMIFNQKQVDDLRVTNNVMQTVLLSIANGPDEPYEALNDPDIMETGTVIGAVNPDGTLVTKEQAREMLVATAKLDERLKAAIDPKGNPNDPVSVVLADTDEDLAQLRKAYDLSSNVPSDDYIFNRISNFGNVLDETRERRGMPYGKDMISSAVINDMTDPDYIPRKKEIDDWRFASKGMDLNPELDDQVYDLKQQGLTDKEVAERLNIPEFDVGPRAAQSQKNKPEDIDARNNAKDSRRADIYDSDQEEVEEEALFGDDDDVLTLDLVRVGRTDEDIPEGDADEVDPESSRFNINESVLLDLDELISRVEDAADDLEESIMRQERRLGIRSQMTEGYAERRGARRRSRGPDGSRPSGGTPPPRPPRDDDDDSGPRPDGTTDEPYTPPAGLGDRPYTREEYENMPIEDLLWLTSAERWQAGELDPQAMRAVRRKVRDLDDDTLQRLAQPVDFVDETGYVMTGQNSLNEEARKRGLIDIDIPDVNVPPRAAGSRGTGGTPSRPSRRGTSEVNDFLLDPSKMSQEQMREFALRILNEDGTMKKLTPQEAEQIRLEVSEIQGLTNRRLYTLYPGKDLDDLTIDELIDKINFDPNRNTSGTAMALRRVTATLTDSEFDDLINRVRAADADNPVRTSTTGTNGALEQLERIQSIRNRAGGVAGSRRTGGTPRRPYTSTLTRPYNAERRARRVRNQELARVDTARRQAFGAGGGETVNAGDPSFQREVWRLRTEEGLSLEQVAERFDTDRGVIRNAEVNYARSLSAEDRAAAGLRAQRATLLREGGRDSGDLSDAELVDTYGERIWELRTRNGLTLEETAEVLGLDRGQVRRAEVGYGRELPSVVRERDYARGRQAALIRQNVANNIAEEPATSGDLPRLDRDRRRPPRAAGSTGAGGTPTPPSGPTPERVFNSLVNNDNDPNVVSLNKADRFGKLNDYFNELDNDVEISNAIQALGGPNSEFVDGPHEEEMLDIMDRMIRENGQIDLAALQDELAEKGFGNINRAYLNYMSLPAIRDVRRKRLTNSKPLNNRLTQGDSDTDLEIDPDPDTGKPKIAPKDVNEISKPVQGLKGKFGRLVADGRRGYLPTAEKDRGTSKYVARRTSKGKQRYIVKLGQDSFPNFLTGIGTKKIKGDIEETKEYKDSLFGKLVGRKGFGVFVTGRTARNLLRNNRPDVWQLRVEDKDIPDIVRALGFKYDPEIPNGTDRADNTFEKADSGAAVSLRIGPDAEGQTTLFYTSKSGEVAEIRPVNGDTIADDLELRDLSINAIALEVIKADPDPDDKDPITWAFFIYDPADGVKDLAVKAEDLNRGDNADPTKSKYAARMFNIKNREGKEELVIQSEIELPNGEVVDVTPESIVELTDSEEFVGKPVMEEATDKNGDVIMQLAEDGTGRMVPKMIPVMEEAKDDDGNLITDANGKVKMVPKKEKPIEAYVNAKAPVIRLLGDPEERIDEDPTIALRLVRRAMADDSELSPDLKDAIRKARLDEADPDALRAELDKAISESASTQKLFRTLDELGLLDKLFPDMVINKEAMGKIRSGDKGNRRPAPHLGQLLKNNSEDDIINNLQRLGYSRETIKAVVALRNMNGLTPEIAPAVAGDLHKSLTNGELTPQDILSYAQIAGLDAPTGYALARLSQNDPKIDGQSTGQFLEFQDLYKDSDYLKDISLSERLLAKSINEGGFSMNMSNQTDVTSGFAVAMNNTGIVVDISGVKKALRKTPDQRTAAEKKQLEEIYEKIFKMINHHKEKLRDKYQGLQVVLGGWRKQTVKTKGGKAQTKADEVDELHLDLSLIIPKDSNMDEDGVKALAREERQEAIADLDALDEGMGEPFMFIDGGGLRPDLLDDSVLDTPKLNAAWEEAKKAKEAKETEITKTRLDPIDELLEKIIKDGDAADVIRNINKAADPDDPLKYPEGVPVHREVADEIETLEIYRRNFDKSLPSDAELQEMHGEEGMKSRVLKAIDDIISEKKGTGPTPERQIVEDEDEAQQLQERLEEAAAAAQQVAIPDPIDGEMDDPEFEQAIIDLRDPIRESALVDGDGNPVLDENGKPTFGIGIENSDLIKSNKKVSGVADNLLENLADDFGIELSQEGKDAAELLRQANLDKDDPDFVKLSAKEKAEYNRELGKAQRERRDKIREALNEAINKITMNFPEEPEEDTDEIIEEGNEERDDLTEGNE